MIYGYSERGIFNSIIYYLYYKNPDLIGHFLEKLGVQGFTEGTYTFKFLNEQSFSGFGSNDLTVIIEDEKKEKKTVVFIEGKVGKYYYLETEYNNIKNNSNIFIQLYLKRLLTELVLEDNKKYEEAVIDKFNKVIGNSKRKIGKNKVVRSAFQDYIKNAEKYYYVAVIPKTTKDTKKLHEYFSDLKVTDDKFNKDNIKCVFWQNIESFFKDKDVKEIIENFKYNRNQIYKAEKQ